MDLISKEAIKKYISAPCTYVDGRRIFYEEDLDLMGSAFDGMTNGEVFQAIFPNASVFENQDNEPYPYIDVFLCGDKDMNCYRKDWWCAPYKGEQE